MARKYEKNPRKKTSKPPAVQPIRSSNSSSGLPLSSLFSNLVPVIPILVITWIVFLPSLQNDFTNWDDETYLIDNEYIKHLSWDRVKYFFAHFYYGNYHPLTMISYLLEYHYHKLNAYPFHLHNLILHVINVALVYILTFLLSGRKDVSFITALFFGIHPMRTESVAWLSERKDMLFALFYISALIFHARLIRNEKCKILNYSLTLLFYLFSLLSKPAAVPLPLALLAIDFLMKREIRWKLLIEKIPHFLIALFFGVIAVLAQQSSDSIAKFETFTLLQRIMFASYGFISYLAMFFVPLNQSCFHPYPFLIEGKRLPYIYYAAPFIALAVFLLIFYFLWRLWKTKNDNSEVTVRQQVEERPLVAFYRIAVSGFAFYFVNVMLVLQLVTVGNAVMAERYTYISYFGLFYLAGSSYALVAQSKKKYFRTLHILMALLFAGGAALFSWMSWERNKAWKNAETLWTDFIGKYPFYHDGYYTRAGYFARLKQYDKAMKDYTMCIKLKPDLAKSYAYRGNIYGLHGKTDSALADYNKAITLDSTYFDAYVNRAITWSLLKNYEKAFYDYDKALSIEPGNVNLLVNRSYAYIEVKQYDKAIVDCDKILAINPNHEQANLYKGISHFNTGKVDEAMEEFNRTIEANPSNPSAWLNLALCYKEKGDFAKALEHAEKSVQLGNKVDEGFLTELRGKAKKP